MPYICDRCSLLCSDLSMLKVHMRKHTKEKPFSCPICNHQFAQKGNLNTHISNVHSSQKRFVCDMCRKQFAQRKTLIKHQIKCEKLSLDSINRDQNSENVSSLRNQIITETTAQHFPSETEDMSNCLKRFNIIQGASDCVDDVRNEQNPQQFMCNKCDMPFKSKEKLVLHSPVHDATVKPFICHVCDKGFAHKGSMNNHIRFVHKGEKPFLCSVCLKKFSNKCHLKLHMRIHSKERRYECDMCRKTFIRIEHYRYHLKTHSRKAKVFGCTMCDCSFGGVVRLRKHMKVHLKGNVEEKIAEMQSDSSSGNEAASFPSKMSSTDSPSAFKSSSVITDSTNIDSTIGREGRCGNSDFNSSNGCTESHEKALVLSHEDETLLLGRGTTSLDVNHLGKGINQEITNNFASLNLVYNDVTSPTLSTGDTYKTILMTPAGSEDSMFLKSLSFNDFVTAQGPFDITTLGFDNFQSSQFHLIQNPFHVVGDSPLMIVLASDCDSLNPVGTGIDCYSVGQTPPTNSYSTDDCSLSNSNKTVTGNASTLIQENKLPPPIAVSSPFTTTTQQTTSSSSSSSSSKSSQSLQLYRCTECNKKFSSSHNLLNHMRVHTGERPYQCDKCSKHFTQTSSLKFHMSSVHGGEKKHECSLCFRCFARRSHLKRHSFIHADEKPYRCPICDHHFIERGKLRTHFTSHNITGTTLDELLLQSKLSSSSSSSSLSSISTNIVNVSPTHPNNYSNVDYNKINIQSARPTTTVSAFNSSEGINLKYDLPYSESFKKHQETSMMTNTNLLSKSSKAVDHRDVMINDEGNSQEHENILKPREAEDQIGRSTLSCSIMTRSKTRLIKSDKDRVALDRVDGARDPNICLSSQMNVRKRLNELRQEKFVNMVTPSSELFNTKPDNSISNETGNSGDSKNNDEQDDHKSSIGLSKPQEYSNPSCRITPSTRRKVCSLKCEQCGKLFSSLAVLRIHSVVHSGLKPHKCNICEKSFTQNSSLKVHISIIHKNTKKYKCTHCPKEFSQQSHLKRHLNIHMGVKPFICDICDKGFQENNKLLLHMKKHEKAAKIVDEKNDNSDSNQHMCTVCSKVFLKKSYLNKHMILHGQMSLYECDQCNKRYRQKSSLDVHMRIHTGEKPFSCDSCDKTFSRHDCLIAHQTTHLSIQERAHTCSVCSQRFARISSLMIHLRKAHDKSGLEQAIKDRKNMQTKRKLASLTRNLPPFACDQCSKRFCHKSTLDIHSRVHSKEKPFFCPICQHSFTQKGSLNFHLKIVHDDERPFQCSRCNQKFTSEKRLMSHNSFSHADKTSTNPLISKHSEDQVVTCRSIIVSQGRDDNANSDLLSPLSIRTCTSPVPGFITQTSRIPSDVAMVFSSTSLPLSASSKIVMSSENNSLFYVDGSILSLSADSSGS